MNDLTVSDLRPMIIVGTHVQRDMAGRYRLNDLHEAAIAAGYNRQSTRPQKFFQWPRAKVILDQLWAECGGRPESADPNRVSTFNPEGSETGPNSVTLCEPKRKSADSNCDSTFPVVAVENGPYEARGTWVVDDLLYTYAFWVDPRFELKVSRTLREMLTGGRDWRAAMLQQTEAWWFARRPHWPAIRSRVLAGETYAAIGRVLRRSPASVANAVRRMIEVGLMSPRMVAITQRGPARLAAQRLIPGWGQQLALDL